MPTQLAEVGEFCPHEMCEFYQELENAQIIQYGRTSTGTGTAHGKSG